MLPPLGAARYITSAKINAPSALMSPSADRPHTATWSDGTNADALSDRCWDTAADWTPPNTLQITFDPPVILSGCLLCAPDLFGNGLPDTVEIDVSPDGHTFHPAVPARDRFNAAYRAGDRIFLKGFLPAMEIPFAPRPTAALRLRATSPRPITIHELFLFAKDESAPPDPTLPVDKCLARLHALDIRFLFADRRQSARLRHHLYGPAIIAHHETLGAYHLLTFHPPPHPTPLHWTGLTLAKAKRGQSLIIAIPDETSAADDVPQPTTYRNARRNQQVFSASQPLRQPRVQ